MVGLDRAILWITLILFCPIMSFKKPLLISRYMGKSLTIATFYCQKITYKVSEAKETVQNEKLQLGYKTTNYPHCLSLWLKHQLILVQLLAIFTCYRNYVFFVLLYGWYFSILCKIFLSGRYLQITIMYL